MWSYNMWPCVSGFFHLAYFRGSSCVACMRILFLFMAESIVCLSHILFIHSSVTYIFCYLLRSWTLGSLKLCDWGHSVLFKGRSNLWRIWRQPKVWFSKVDAFRGNTHFAGQECLLLLTLLLGKCGRELCCIFFSFKRTYSVWIPEVGLPSRIRQLTRQKDVGKHSSLNL